MLLHCFGGVIDLEQTSFFNPVLSRLKDVEKVMLSQADGYHPDLQAALTHLLSSGGKRIRPTITLLTGMMLGADTEKLVILAAAIELLHTATLVHDDLIDSALLRRGIPTLNSKWTPGSTVLTGDFMFARAAKLAADAESVEVMKLFGETLAIIVNGEITQLFGGHCRADRTDYFNRIYAKTASLFETSTKVAALISPVNRQTVEIVRRFGYQIGVAFQILDDILDFTADSARLGKPVGSDLRQGLITLPALYYFEQHADEPEVKEILAGRCDFSEDKLSRLITAIRDGDAIDQAHNEACDFVENGLADLRQLLDTRERRALEDLAQYIVRRDY
jgi:geranylgeranyl pyrophosphate synthase